MLKQYNLTSKSFALYNKKVIFEAEVFHGSGALLLFDVRVVVSHPTMQDIITPPSPMMPNRRQNKYSMCSSVAHSIAASQCTWEM